MTEKQKKEIEEFHHRVKVAATEQELQIIRDAVTDGMNVSALGAEHTLACGRVIHAISERLKIVGTLT